MRCYQTIRHTPLGELTTAEHGLLQLERAMLLVREKANEIRMTSWAKPSEMNFFVGWFHGVRFTILDCLDYWDIDYKDFSEVADRYATEVSYLKGPYLANKGN